MMYLRSFSYDVSLSMYHDTGQSGILTPSCSYVSSLVHRLLFGVSDSARKSFLPIFSSRQTLPEVCSEQDELDFLMEALIIRWDSCRHLKRDRTANCLALDLKPSGSLLCPSHQELLEHPRCAVCAELRGSQKNHHPHQLQALLPAGNKQQGRLISSGSRANHRKELWDNS